MEIGTVCRLCLNSNKNASKSLMDVTYNAIPFLNIYYELVGVSFIDYPTFPAMVCPTCETELIVAYRFQEMCLKTEEKLKDLEGQESSAAAIEFIPTSPESKDIACPEIEIKLEVEDFEITIPDDPPSTIPERPMKKEAALKNSMPQLGMKIKPIQCTRCADVFKEFHLFKKHKCCKSQIKPKHQQKPQKPANLTTHTQFEEFESVKCKTCGKILRNRKSLKQHSRVHSDEKNYICPVCSEGFTWNITLKSHVRRLHPDKVHLLQPYGAIVNKGYLQKMVEYGTSVIP